MIQNPYTRKDVNRIAPRKGVRKNKDGSESTHLMSYTEADNKFYAYPTLFQNNNDWTELSDNNDWAAFKEAQKRKEIFEFKNEADAKSFAEGDWKTKQDQFAYGGFKNNTMNNINEFNGGGSHQQNPLGGIPIGMNQQTGQQQTVEEGETMSKVSGKDFIFSTKYYLTMEDIKDLGLPKNLAGLSMSDATKKLNELYEDREDPISTKTKSEFLERISIAQETKKAAEEQMIQEAMQMNADAGYMDPEGMAQEPMEAQQMDMMEDPSMMEDPNAIVPNAGGMDPTQMQFVGGGFLGMGGMTGAAKLDTGVNAATSAIGGAMDLFGQASGNTSPKAGVAALSGAASGASVGSAIFPGIGTAVGAGVGAIAGVFGSKAARKKIRREEDNRAKAAVYSNSDQEIFAKGGYKDSLFPTSVGNYNGEQPYGAMMHSKPAVHNSGQYNKGSIQNTILGEMEKKKVFKDNALSKLDSLGEKMNAGIDRMSAFSGGVRVSAKDDSLLNPPTINTKSKLVLPNQLDFNVVGNSPTEKSKSSVMKGLNPNTLMRMAPVISNFSQMVSMQKPNAQIPIQDKSKATRRYIDESAALNQINQQNNSQLDAINKLGGSTGGRRNAILASNLMRNRAIGDAALNAKNYNNQIDIQADALDMQTGKENIQRQEIARENYDKDLGAYRTNKSKLQSDFANDIGKIGNENMLENRIAKMYGYTSNGTFMQPTENTEYANLTDEEIQNITSGVKAGDKTLAIKEANNRKKAMAALARFNKQQVDFSKTQEELGPLFNQYSPAYKKRK